MKTSKLNLLVCFMLIFAVCLTFGVAPLTKAHAAHSYSANGKLLYYVDCGNLVDASGAQAERGEEGLPSNTATTKMLEMGVSFPSSSTIADSELYNSVTDNVYGADSVTGYYWGFVEYDSWNWWRYSATGINEDGYKTCRYINENSSEGILKYTFQVDDAETELKVILGLAWIDGWSTITDTITINGVEKENVQLSGGSSAEKTYEDVVGVQAEDGNYYVTIQIGDANNTSAISYIVIQTENWVPGKNITYSATNAFVEKGTVPSLTSSEGDVVEGEITAEAQAKISDADYFSTVVVDVAVKGTETVVKACNFIVIPAGCEYFVNVGSDGNGDLLLADVVYSEELGYGYTDVGGTSAWQNYPYNESVRYNDVSQELLYQFDVENGAYVVYFGSISYWGFSSRTSIYALEGGKAKDYVALDSGSTFRDGAIVSDGQLNVAFTKGANDPLITFILILKGYEVSFNADNGSAISSAFYLAGEKVAMPEAPAKEAVGSTKYVFEKWVNAETNEEYDFNASVSANVTLKAVYSEQKTTYSVSFCDDESFPIGIDSQTIEDGGKVTKPADPIKEATAQYTYTFAGWFNGENEWDFENDVVTGNMFLVAKFTEALNAYRVNFVDENGDAIDGITEQEIGYGNKVTKPADPTKEATAEHTYTFAGWFNGENEWDFENDVVEDHITLTAKFTQSDREYTLTIVYADGTPTETETYSYGDMASLDFARDGYTHVITLNGQAITELEIVEDATITVTYTLIEDSSSDGSDGSSSNGSSINSGDSSSNDGSSDKPGDSNLKSCKSSLAGGSVAFLVAIALGFVIKKRK